MKQLGLRRFWSTFGFTRVPFSTPIFEPHPFGHLHVSPGTPSPVSQIAGFIEESTRRLGPAVQEPRPRQLPASAVALLDLTPPIFVVHETKRKTVWPVWGPKKNTCVQPARYF